MIEELNDKVSEMCQLFYEAQDMLKEEGIELITGAIRPVFYPQNGELYEVHVLKGIKRLAELIGGELFHPMDITGKRDYILAVKSGDVLYYTCVNEDGSVD